MADWEESALAKSPVKPLHYYRLIWTYSRTEFDEFIGLLNHYHPSITVKHVIDNNLVNFLDVTTFMYCSWVWRFQHTNFWKTLECLWGKWMERVSDGSLSSVFSTGSPISKAQNSGCTKDRENYCKLRNQVTKLNQRKNKQYYALQLTRTKNDPKKLWSMLNDIMGRKTSPQPTFIESGGIFITKPKEIADYLNIFFRSKVNKLRKESSQRADNSSNIVNIKDYMKDCHAYLAHRRHDIGETDTVGSIKAIIILYLQHMHPVQALSNASVSVPASGQAGKRDTSGFRDTVIYRCPSPGAPPLTCNSQQLLQLLLQVK